jgi:hypothetical protein
VPPAAAAGCCLQGGKLYLIIVYPNSRNTEVRARCCIRGVPQLAAANRLDLEELLSFDRDTGSSSSMLGSSGESQADGGRGGACWGPGRSGETEGSFAWLGPLAWCLQPLWLVARAHCASHVRSRNSADPPACAFAACTYLFVKLQQPHTDPDEDPAGVGNVTNYRRGLAPCVFIAWENVASSVLNLPIQEMDYYMPG